MIPSCPQTGQGEGGRVPIMKRKVGNLRDEMLGKNKIGKGKKVLYPE